jgi:hypothetical protein
VRVLFTSLALRFEQEFVDGLLHEIVRSASLFHTDKIPRPSIRVSPFLSGELS